MLFNRSVVIGMVLLTCGQQVIAAQEQQQSIPGQKQFERMLDDSCFGVEVDPLIDGCVSLTPAAPNKVGAYWQKDPIVDIDEFSIDYTVSVVKGSMPAADGMAFVLQAQGNDIKPGCESGGGCLGYCKIKTSLAVELRTYETNFQVKLVSIDDNGYKTTQGTSVQPSFSLDDGEERVLNVQYDGSTLKTYLDGELYLTASFGIAEFFSRKLVYHGMTAATGTLYSGHNMCFQEPTGSPTSGPTGSPTSGPSGSHTGATYSVKLKSIRLL